MKIFLTGATGFIGTAFLKKVLDQGWQVTALVRDPKRLTVPAHPSLKLVTGDLVKPEPGGWGLQGHDAVVHLAGVLFARSQAAFDSANVGGTASVLEATVAAGVPRFVFVSSCAASGPSRTFVAKTEEASPEPVSYYGQSKLRAETVVLGARSKTHVTILRPPIVYGPGDQDVAKLIKLVRAGFAIRFIGKSESRQKYYSAIFVEDLVRGLVMSVTHPAPSGEIFHLVGKDCISSNDFFAVVGEHLGVRPMRIPVPNWFLETFAMWGAALSERVNPNGRVSRDKIREMIPDFWVFSGEKARKVMGFEPEMDYRSGMARTVVR